ncbi:MAG: hypothetical protein R6V10_00365 [bacterium]
MNDATNGDIGTDILIYRTEDGKTRVEVLLNNENVWMTQAALAELYQTTPQNITLHVNAIYKDRELKKESTCKEFLQVRREGKRWVTFPH